MYKLVKSYRSQELSSWLLLYFLEERNIVRINFPGCLEYMHKSTSKLMSINMTIIDITITYMTITKLDYPKHDYHLHEYH